MSISLKCEGLSKCLEFKSVKDFAELLGVLEVETNAHLTKLIQPLGKSALTKNQRDSQTRS